MKHRNVVYIEITSAEVNAIVRKHLLEAELITEAHDVSLWPLGPITDLGLTATCEIKTPSAS